jgi:response regulator RpfG family c-di-GMP phosphodiesterase
MLTGNADQHTASVAVNNAGVFRFVNKPCSIEDIIFVIDDALEQYRLLIAEKELLQNTLSGSIKVLTDLLSFLNPTSFGSTLNYREIIRSVTSKLGIVNSWDIELAMMLSDIGTFMVPKELLEKEKQNQLLKETEIKILERIPETGKKLISNIPRLEKVAEAIYYSKKNYDGSGFPKDDISGEAISISARIIHILKDYDRYLKLKEFPEYAFEMLEIKKNLYDPNILEVVKEVLNLKKLNEVSKIETKIFEVTTKQLFPGQIILEDIYTNDEVLLVKKGTEISETMIHRIANYGAISGIRAPILVDCLMPMKK